MGRTVSSDLQGLLDLDGCDSHTTLSIYPVAGDPIHMATDKFSFDGINYESDLEVGEDIRQSIGTVTNRFTALVQQVTRTFGELVASEGLVKATGVVGRYYWHNDTEAWVELFRGEVITTAMEEQAIRIEILHDLVAAGFCVANWTLAEKCNFVFKDPETCGYTGSETNCNKRRRSMHGCQGRNNEHRFGGMEYPDVQVPAPPVWGGGGGGDGDGGDPGGWPPGPKDPLIY